jgi:hypothetical protein
MGYSITKTEDDLYYVIAGEFEVKKIFKILFISILLFSTFRILTIQTFIFIPIFMYLISQEVNGKELKRLVKFFLQQIFTKQFILKKKTG